MRSVYKGMSPNFLLVFGANNKKNYVLRNPELPKDLSISNDVMVGVSDTYPRRSKHGITLPHKR
jgi:hypothetical protein